MRSGFGLRLALLLGFFSSTAWAGGTVSNSVLSLGISGNHGGSIDSLKVLGTEVIDTSDLGREMQASVFVQKPYFYPTHRPDCTSATNNDAPNWFNPQDGGDTCGNGSVVTGFSTAADGYINVISQARDWNGVTLWDQNNPGSTFLPTYFSIEGHHKIGPLPYSPHQEAIRLYYVFTLDPSAPTPSVSFMDQVTDSEGQPTPASFVPAIYFRRNILNRLFGLRMDGSGWDEVIPRSSSGLYTPSLYSYRAMAWMTSDLGWGVGLYGRSTLGQPANFAATSYPAQGVSAINLIHQGLGTIGQGQSATALIHLSVGNLGTIQGVINEIHDAGY